MDWNLKALYWDLADVDEATLPNVETMDHESSRFGAYRTKGDFSVDLKLGQMGNSGNELSAKPNKFKDAAVAGVVSKMTGSPSGSSKRARAISNGTVTVSCLVDGCNSDLSNCRDYHRRHKVCELHSKTPEVTIGGLKQRFCQQCSRFHSLEQFDEGKRSCRKRLDGHNRRRRKPQPEPLTRPGSFLSNYQGTQLLPFSRPHAFPSTTVVNPGWSGGLVTTSCSDARIIHNHNQHQQVQLVEKQDLFLGSSPTSYKQGKQISFLHGENPSTAAFNNQNPPLPASSICHTLLRTGSLSESGGVRTKMFCDSLTTNSVHDSPCALSLLSSSQTHTPGNAIINQMVQPHDSMSLMQLQPLGLSLHDNSLESVDRVVVPNGSDHCSSMYNMVSDRSQGNEASQLFPFQWE